MIVITISIIQKRDAKIVVTPIFNMIWVTLKRRIIIEQIKHTCTDLGFFFKTTLKFENSMILVTLNETWMWIKRWNLWRRCATQCDAIQVRRCHFIQRWSLGDLTIVGTSFSVWDSICKSWNEHYFFPWSFFIVDSKYLHIFLVCWFTNEI